MFHICPFSSRRNSDVASRISRIPGIFRGILAWIRGSPWCLLKPCRLMHARLLRVWGRYEVPAGKCTGTLQCVLVHISNVALHDEASKRKCFPASPETSKRSRGSDYRYFRNPMSLYRRFKCLIS